MKSIDHNMNAYGYAGVYAPSVDTVTTMMRVEKIGDIYTWKSLC
ncbi:MAG: hypothetical protein CSYNP_01675 [Syntrophus sp. SKADARSKE-3]|nr:hypothetical protein [Syntrophus sp. SKADARSKE-3]